MLNEFALAATVCVINVIASRVCVRVSRVCERARRRGGAVQPSERPAVPTSGEQLSPQRGCEPRSSPAEALRTDGWHACDGRSASRPSNRSARDAQQGRIEQRGIRSVYAMNFDTASSTARLEGVGAT